jgi:hypothetical protein
MVAAPRPAARSQITVIASEAKQSIFVIPGWSAGPDPESRDSGLDASHRPGITAKHNSAFSLHDVPELCMNSSSL